MSDPASYRTKEELEKYRLDDPITRLRAQLTREGKLTNEKFDQIDKKAKETALAAVKFARSGERRVGEEGRSRGAPHHLKKKKTYLTLVDIGVNDRTVAAMARGLQHLRRVLMPNRRRFASTVADSGYMTYT